MTRCRTTSVGHRILNPMAIRVPRLCKYKGHPMGIKPLNVVVVDLMGITQPEEEDAMQLLIET